MQKDSKVRIGAFNIKQFGVKKLNDQFVMKTIIKILKRYDIVLCQEVHLDKKMIKQLVTLLSKSSSVPYSCLLSQLTGKERYLYLYNSNKWEVLENYLIKNKKFDRKFFRVPYVARFQNLKNPHIRITLVGCHTHPNSAYKEIKALVDDVYVDIKARLEKRDSFSVLINLLYCFGSSCISSNDDEPIVIMGDFNASGSYLKKDEQNKLDKILYKNGLMWGIDHL
ncbi:31697_t:CDS:1, partial [Gigaspora margarita]